MNEAPKRILLGLLADAACERLDLHVGDATVDATARWYRARFDLVRRSDFEAFLSDTRVTAEAFRAQMRTFSNIDALHRHEAARIQQRLPRYRALFSVRDWLLRTEDQR